MPPKFLFDTTGIDFNAVMFDQAYIRKHNPQRGAMEHLDAIIWADPTRGLSIGRKNVREDEFWVEGHIPGRPLLPGVIMLETAAQHASFYTKEFIKFPGFIGFGGLGDTKFRAEVKPGATLFILCHHTWSRHRRVGCNMQGIVDNQIVFETSIIGTMM